MDKTVFMVLGTILKFGLGTIALILSLTFLIQGITQKDNKKLKLAGLIFIGTWVILFILGAVEVTVLAADEYFK